MKIYTKGGDEGLTSLWGGKRVSKADLRIDAYGTIDELNVHIGLIRVAVNNPNQITLLEGVQRMLFTFGAHLAADPDKKSLNLPKINNNHVNQLEKAIDQMEEELPQLTSFILPGGDVEVSYCHLGRVVCRRAERMVIALNNENQINPAIIIYLNRLSDYLFVLSRYVAQQNGVAELPWQPEN